MTTLDAGRTGSGPAATTEVAPVLSVRNLVKHFPVRSRGIVRRRVGDVHAVCDVSFDIGARETLSLVGESGCGKSTTARLLLNLIPPTAGSVHYGGRDLTTLTRRQKTSCRVNSDSSFSTAARAVRARS